VIDAFIHPVQTPSEADLFDLDGFPWETWLSSALAEMDQHGVAASGVCIMDPGILRRPAALRTLTQASASGRFWFTLVPDFRSATASDTVRRAAESGFRGLTFHSYLQRIAPPDYETVAELAALAHEARLFTGLCTAYGSKRIFDFHSLPLAAAVARSVSGPVLLYHAGGARILEAMLMCEMWPQLLLETSFSLTYWLGSSVETDFAFAFRKIGCERVLFGSDAPFLSRSRAIHDHQNFLARHGFAPVECDRILRRNAADLLGIQVV